MLVRWFEKENGHTTRYEKVVEGKPPPVERKGWTIDYVGMSDGSVKVIVKSGSSIIAVSIEHVQVIAGGVNDRRPTPFVAAATAFKPNGTS